MLLNDLSQVKNCLYLIDYSIGTLIVIMHYGYKCSPSFTYLFMDSFKKLPVRDCI